MKKACGFASMVAVLAVCWMALPTLAPAGGGKRSDSVVKIKSSLEKAPAGMAVVLLHLDIAPGWHLYANPVDHEDLESGAVVVKVANANANITYPPGKVVNDKTLGKYKIYENKITIRATVDRDISEANPLDVSVRLQSCDDKNCLPPATVKLTVAK